MKRKKEIRRIQRRLEDIALGVAGSGHRLDCLEWAGDDLDVGIGHDLGTDGLARFVLAVQSIWRASSGENPEPGRVCPFNFKLHNLAHFDEPLPQLAEWLYENRGRARPNDLGELG